MVKSKNLPQPGPSKTVVAKAFQLLLSTAPRERGKTKAVSSFRANADVVKYVMEHATDAGLKKTDVMNSVMATFVDYVNTAAPHAALFAVLAEQQGASPAQLIVRLALEKAIEAYPELASRIADKPKK